MYLAYWKEEAAQYSVYNGSIIDAYMFTLYGWLNSQSNNSWEADLLWASPDDDSLLNSGWRKKLKSIATHYFAIKCAYNM